MNYEQRHEIELKIVKHLIETMAKEGWKVIYVNDGGARVTPEECNPVETVFSVCEAHIVFENEDERRHWALIVLGNDGCDCIADYSYAENNTDNFRQIMEEQIDPFCEKLEQEAA